MVPSLPPAARATKALPENDVRSLVTLVYAALGSSRGLLHETLRHSPGLDQRVKRLHDRAGKVAIEVSIDAEGRHSVLVTGIEPGGTRVALSRVATTTSLPDAPARVSVAEA